MLLIDNLNKRKQYALSISLVITVSGICYVLSPLVGYQVVALILLVTVSLIAVTFDILPVLLAAALSAFTWDFFFIPPRFTIHVSSTENTILLIMYFIIAMVNAVLTYKIKQISKLARQKEEKANAIKLYNTLLNSLSHELRTPISTIIAATDNLREGNSILSLQDKDQLVAEISKASVRLNQQVENLLNMSRLESGFIKPKFDWCDISEIIYTVIKRIGNDDNSRHIVINIDEEMPLLKSDKALLDQILYNLVNNAVLYTPQTASIYITAAYFANSVKIMVEDNGKGFPEKEISKVFNKFYRLENAKAGGTGLGLSIVKGFTEALGGTVELKNKSQGGACFTVQIPVETANLKLE